MRLIVLLLFYCAHLGQPIESGEQLVEDFHQVRRRIRRRYGRETDDVGVQNTAITRQSILLTNSQCGKVPFAFF